MTTKACSAPAVSTFLLLTGLFVSLYLLALSAPPSYYSDMVNSHSWLSAAPPASCNRSSEATAAAPGTLTVPQFVQSSQFNATSAITLVTAFFPLSSSKHSVESYTEWLHSFFSRIETPVVVYTTPAYANVILAARGTLPIYLSVEYSTPFDTAPLRGLEAQYYGKQHDIDRERDHHNGGLYAVWNAKAALVNRSIELNPFSSDYFFWVDAGCFREVNHPFRHWPDVAKVEQIFQGRQDMPLVQVIQPLPASVYTDWKLSDGPLDYDYIAAAIFGGHRTGMQRFVERFYELHNRYLAEGKFVGKDQTVYNALITQDRQRVLVAAAYTQYCGNVWFHLQAQLASANESIQLCDQDLPATNVVTIAELVGK